MIYFPIISIFDGSHSIGSSTIVDCQAKIQKAGGTYYLRLHFVHSGLYLSHSHCHPVTHTKGNIHLNMIANLHKLQNTFSIFLITMTFETVHNFVSQNFIFNVMNLYVKTVYRRLEGWRSNLLFQKYFILQCAYHRVWLKNKWTLYDATNHKYHDIIQNIHNIHKIYTHIYIYIYTYILLDYY